MLVTVVKICFNTNPPNKTFMTTHPNHDHTVRRVKELGGYETPSQRLLGEKFRRAAFLNNLGIFGGKNSQQTRNRFAYTPKKPKKL
jgi:hypothetical protein